MKIVGHFRGIGWAAPREEYEVLWFPDRRLEALKLESSEHRLLYKVKSGKNVIECENGQIAGTTGKSCPIYAISIDLKEEEYGAVYRVWLKGIGWTAFCRDGGWCGGQLESGEIYVAGVQIFLHRKVEPQVRYEEAEQALRDYCRVRENLFVKNEEKLLLAATHHYLTRSERKAEIVENGFILPLQKKGDSLDGIYAGGVADAEGHFVAGHERYWEKRYNYGCVETYPFAKGDQVKRIEETVIFGGVIIRFFGHFLTECLSRIWYALEHTQERIVFLTIPGQEAFIRDFFQILEIEERILVVTEVTEFARIVVPEQTIRLWSDYREGYITVYDRMRSNVQPKQYGKVYLSRTAYQPQDGINERFFEDFYRKRGYEVICPERHSVREQIEIMAGAEEVVCTEGTLSHLALFCAPHTRLVIIRRAEDNILIPQLIINQARQLEAVYIDATFNFMPVKHSGGTFLYGPTEKFVRYLKKNGIGYEEDEVKFDLSRYCYDYMNLWLRRVNNVRLFNMVSEYDLYDIINMMNPVFGLPRISRDQYATKGKKDEKKYQQEIERLRKENRELREKVKLLTGE